MIKQITLSVLFSFLISIPSISQIEFIKAWEDSISTDSWAVELGDIDGDTDLDAVIANEGNQNFGSVLMLNDGFGSFSVGQQLNESAKGATFGDLDNDGDLDICLTNTDFIVTIWVNDGNGSFTLSGEQIPTHSGFEDIRAGFLNADSLLDIVVLNLEHPDEIFFNNGDLTFEKSAQELGLNGIDGAGGIELGDLNGDGFTDIFKGNWGIPCAQVWINDGTGYFTELSQNFGNISEHIHGVALCDFDNDSDLDVFLGYSAENIESEIWFNDGNGFFELNQTINLYSSNLIQDISTADFDNDGDQDAFVSTLWGNNTLLLNDGTGVFTESQFIFPFSESLVSAVGDLDGDNIIDLFVTSNTWFECLGYNSSWLNISFTDIPLIKVNEQVICPNPTTNKIKLINFIGRNGDSRFALYNINGKIVLQGQLRENVIDVSELPNGVYYIKFNNGIEKYEEKIIKN